MTQQRSEETRMHILEAATRRFSLQGYEAASVDDICTEAGVSKGAFYHHFPSKQTVFLALLETWLKALDVGMEAMRKPTVPETLVEMTRVLPIALATARGRLPMFLEFWLQASRDETVWKATIAPYRHYRDTFTKLIEEGIAEGSLKPVDAQAAATALVSMAIGLLLQGVLDPNSTDWQELAEHSMQMFMDSLSKAKS